MLQTLAATVKRITGENETSPKKAPRRKKVSKEALVAQWREEIYKLEPCGFLGVTGPTAGDKCLENPQCEDRVSRQHGSSHHTLHALPGYIKCQPELGQHVGRSWVRFQNQRTQELRHLVTRVSGKALPPIKLYFCIHTRKIKFYRGMNNKDNYNIQ